LQLTADKTILHGTDATDDAQLVVTVLDGDGKPVSNSPDVTLSIESGPGEFPTGPAITFRTNSDIAIRDGQAAMEFRSYYAGSTVIRAHADGLTDATLHLAIEGSPEFVAGQTPVVAARPYVRFATPRKTAAEQVLGKDAPTRASSETPDHPGRLANDGDEKTFWSANNSEPGAWWEVDLERLCVIKGASLTFPDAGNYRFKITTSVDGQQWHPATDESETSDTNQTRNEAFAPGSSGRYVRITFTGLPQDTPARLSEVQIRGNIVPQ